MTTVVDKTGGKSIKLGNISIGNAFKGRVNGEGDLSLFIKLNTKGGETLFALNKTGLANRYSDYLDPSSVIFDYEPVDLEIIVTSVNTHRASC
jgi:hypothetical protein